MSEGIEPRIVGMKIKDVDINAITKVHYHGSDFCCYTIRCGIDHRDLSNLNCHLFCWYVRSIFKIILGLSVSKVVQIKRYHYETAIKHSLIFNYQMSNMLKIITEELINKVKINSLLTQYFYDWVIFVEESFFVLRMHLAT